MNIKNTIAFMCGMLKRHPRISKGWKQWSRSELLLLECESLGILLPGRLGVGSEFCINGELSGDASAVGWRTTLWVAGPTREDLCHSRAHQTCGGLVSAYLSSPRPHPGTQPPRDTRGWSWPFLCLNSPPSAWHLPSL